MPQIVMAPARQRWHLSQARASPPANSRGRCSAAWPISTPDRDAFISAGQGFVTVTPGGRW